MAEKKRILSKLYIANIFFIVVLFYAGVHLNEEEKAFLAGLRPSGDSYAWATSFYAGLEVMCTFFAGYVAVKTMKIMPKIGATMLLLSVIAFGYSIVVLSSSIHFKMEEVLLVYGPCIVLGMWLNAYAMMVREQDIV